MFLTVLSYCLSVKPTFDKTPENLILYYNNQSIQFNGATGPGILNKPLPNSSVRSYPSPFCYP